MRKSILAASTRTAVGGLPKVFSRGSRSPDIVDIFGVDRATRLGPHRAKVDQLALQAFYVEPQCRPAGTDQSDHPPGRVALVELDREQVEHGLLVLAIDIAALDGVDTVEAQGCTAALELCGLTKRPRPVEPGQTHHQPLFGGSPTDVADSQRRILQMGGNHL